MKRAFGKKELMAVVPVSMSTIDRMERNGEFPQRFWITDKRWSRILLCPTTHNHAHCSFRGNTPIY